MKKCKAGVYTYKLVYVCMFVHICTFIYQL